MQPDQQSNNAEKGLRADAGGLECQTEAPAAAHARTPVVLRGDDSPRDGTKNDPRPPPTDQSDVSVLCDVVLCRCHIVVSVSAHLCFILSFEGVSLACLASLKLNREGQVEL